MNIYDIVCGKCKGHVFKGNSAGESECQGCGYVLNDEDMDRLLSMAYKETIAEQKVENIKE